MKLKGLMLLLVAMFALGMIAAGCGGDDGNDESDVTINTTDGVSSEELEDAAQDAEASITEALDDPEAFDKCKQGAEALSGDQEEAALQACEQVFGGS